MQSNSGDAFPKVKEEENYFTESSSRSHFDITLPKPVDIAPLEGEVGKEVHAIKDEGDQSNENAPNQLVVYNPEANGTGQIEPVSDLIGCQPSPFRSGPTPNRSSRVLPSVGAFTVQCANCFKWRLIPTKEKYEQIRESILQQPFVCETAREWRPDISCEDPADISQDGSRLWAIDKPNIAQPPPGWQRLLRIRGEGSSKFADVYYVAPSGKRLRSTVEVQKYLLEHPEYVRAGVTMAQFSFQIPKPLQENYVRKRTGMSRPLEPTVVNPLSWARPDDCEDLHIDRPGLSNSYFEAPVFDPVAPPAKKLATRTPSKHSSNSVYDQTKIKEENPQPSCNGIYDL